FISRGRRLRRQDFERNQTGRLAGDAAYEIRTGYQPQDRQGVWPRSTADAARPRRRGGRVRRREFITLLGGAAPAWPLAALAQQRERMRRIGVLLFGTPNTDPNLGAFLQGLRELGYIETQSVAIDYRYAEGKPDRLRGLAGELVATKPDVIFALG